MKNTKRILNSIPKSTIVNPILNNYSIPKSISYNDKKGFILIIKAKPNSKNNSLVSIEDEYIEVQIAEQAQDNKVYILEN